MTRGHRLVSLGLAALCGSAGFLQTHHVHADQLAPLCDGMNPSDYVCVDTSAGIGPLGPQFVPNIDYSVGNTGVAIAPLDTQQVADLTYTPDVKTLAAKEQFADVVVEPLVDANLAAGLTGVQACPQVAVVAGTPCISPSRSLSQPLHKQERYYTCGPASTRNVLQQITGTDFGEAPLAAEEGTRQDNGTVAGSIARVLNNHQTANDFGAVAPKSPNQLMAWVTDDVYYFGTSLVVNVTTTPLQFWSGKTYYHYDVVYGYNHNNGGTLNFAEEYDPHYLGYNTPWNPFGYHTDTLSNAYSAVHSSPSHDAIW